MQIIVTLSVICAECHTQAFGMLNDIKLNVIMLNVMAPVFRVRAGNTKGVSITVPLTSCLTGLESAV